jgi:hypothetical protein
MEILCECNSFCSKKVEITDEEFRENLRRRQIVISNDCPHGPEESDSLVEEREFYKIYQEG